MVSVTKHACRIGLYDQGIQTNIYDSSVRRVLKAECDDEIK